MFAPSAKSSQNPEMQSSQPSGSVSPQTFGLLSSESEMAVVAQPTFPATPVPTPSPSSSKQASSASQAPSPSLSGGMMEASRGLYPPQLDS